MAVNPQPGSAASRPSAFARTVMGPTARTINPVMRRMAGRGNTTLSIVYHRGRVSGKDYATPVEARVVAGQAVIPLVFGTQADWCQNLRTAGRGRLRSRDKEYEISRPEVLRHDAIRPLLRNAFPALERVITFRLMGVSEFLVLQATPLN